jgi:hypothetical protein
METPDDVVVTAKAREIQRGMLAEMREDFAEAKRHLLAAANLELVLAGDYATVGEESLAVRSRISAGSCLWRSGDVQRGRQVLEQIIYDHPEKTKAVQSVIYDLKGHSEPQSL